MTSNQFYGGLNRRFDKRTDRLRSLGFRYVRLTSGDITGSVRPATLGAFVRSRYGKDVLISASEVIHAGKRAWFDSLRSALT